MLKKFPVICLVLFLILPLIVSCTAPSSSTLTSPATQTPSTAVTNGTWSLNLVGVVTRVVDQSLFAERVNYHRVPSGATLERHRRAGLVRNSALVTCRLCRRRENTHEN